MNLRIFSGAGSRLVVVALGGCNALLDISEHQRAGGSAGDENAGGSEVGGPQGGSGGPGSAGAGMAGDGGAPDSGGGGAGPDEGAGGDGGTTETGGGAAGEPHVPPTEGGTTGATGGTATGGTATGGTASGGVTGECGSAETRCAEGKLQSCESGLWSAAVECDGYCSEGVCVVPPSCDGIGAGVSSCGPEAELCCNSRYVPGTRDGEPFYRSYDGTSEDPDAMAAPASVSGFFLDRFEVTVGRFRRFLEATQNPDALPQEASGKHQHLPDGALHDTILDDPEHGWRSAWNQYLSLSEDAPGVGSAACPPGNRTWTPTPGGNEDKPIVCANWFEAYAFCIWDGGFLPSEAEWNYAAAGGTLQRAYPWSDPASSTAIECEVHAHFGQSSDRCAEGEERPAAVGSYPEGEGRWKHLDLAGNVGEWTLDTGAAYVTPCTDCAAIGSDASDDRVLRGGTFYNPAEDLLNARRNPWPADPQFAPTPEPNGDTLKTYRSFDSGFRCARSPRE